MDMSVSDSPKISVIIPAYNAEATIERALASVFVQQGVNLEVIIVDDCSGDATCQVVEAKQQEHPEILLVSTGANQGASGARNLGIEKASGEYVAFLDADDIWKEGKLAAQLAVLEAQPEVVLVTCNSLQVDPDGKMLKEAHVNKPPVEGPLAWKTLLSYNFMPTPTVMTRKAVLDRVGGFSLDLVVGEDLDLWIRIAMQGAVHVLPEVYVHYYDYPASLSKRGQKGSDIAIIQMVKNHINNAAGSLTPTESKQILGQRYYELGLHHFFSGLACDSVSLYWKSLFAGYKPIKSSIYILRSLAKCLFSSKSHG